MFLATFLIGLREGLEATLIVGILAAFLKRNGASLRPLILASLGAVALSIAVGVGLMLASSALPQAQQEAMETIIGIIAVVFVTTMILWMNVNARNMKKSLESEAEESMSKGGEMAMAGMAFLAIMKEGFETAVFLIAVFQASSGDTTLGIVGAVIGILLAIVIGYAIYWGGAHFNLGTFFKVTGPFLILIAAGFVANVFRTGHEAGWVNVGQAQVFDFSAVIRNDSVVGALIQGMFSIQADPRLIEVIAWFAYLIPVMVIYLWPQSHEFTLDQRIKTKRGFAIALAAAAVIMFIVVPRGSSDVAGSTRQVEENNGGVTSVTLVSTENDQAHLQTDTGQEYALDHVSDGELDGAPLVQWESNVPETADSSLPTKLTLNELAQLNGGRLPSGINTERTPGPFKAKWSQYSVVSATTSDTSLVTASNDNRLIATLSGGGISGTRDVSVNGTLTNSWSVSDDESSAARKAIQQGVLNMEEMTLWWAWIPVAMLGTGIGLFLSSLWDVRKERRAEGEKQQTAAAGA